MTLILGMSKAEGIYLSADFRVMRAGKVEDDAAPKLMIVQFPPIEGGTRGLLAFTGAAEARDRTPLGRWLRETMRGEPQYPDQLLDHLQERLDRDVGPLRTGLAVVALFMEGDHGQRRLRGIVTNLAPGRGGKGIELRPTFAREFVELSEPFAFGSGSGVHSISAQDWQLLGRQKDIRPAAVSDHMNLLAAVNRRVATRNPTVSPACHVAFLSAVPPQPEPDPTDPRCRTQAQSYNRDGECAPEVMPQLLGALDVSEIMEDFMLRVASWNRDGSFPEISTDELNRRIRRRP